MKTTTKLLLAVTFVIVLVAILMIGCQRAHEKDGEHVSVNASPSEKKSEPLDLSGSSSTEGLLSSGRTDRTFSSNVGDAFWDASSNANTTGFMSSSAAVEDRKDTMRKFIRTADMRFRVKNVLQATYSIESIAKQFDGFVTYTHLSSNIDKKTIIPVSADSSLETIYHTVVNDITLRVPNTKLDTTLKTISALIDYLDYRTIKAEDVALRMLANRLEQDRATKSGKRLEAAIDDQGKKLRETTSAEELLSRKHEQADAARIALLTLQDKINFSTITLNIYQRQTMKRELIANDKNIEEYKPGFGARILYGLKWGWQLLQSVFIFIAHIWGLIVLAVVAFILYKVLSRKRKS